MLLSADNLSKQLGKQQKNVQIIAHLKIMTYLCLSNQLEPAATDKRHNNNDIRTAQKLLRGKRRKI